MATESAFRAPGWLNGAANLRPGQGQHFYTSDRYPLFYLQITKCGSTFLRNLIYQLDHDAPHADAGRIHAYPQDFRMAGAVPVAVMAQSPFVFAVVRDPVDRFLSLYFDKLVNPDNIRDEGIRRRVARAAGLDLDPGLSLDGHRANCVRALDWIGRNLAGHTPRGPNPHWQRQSVRLAHGRGLPVRVLTLEGLDAQLERLLAPLVPDIATRIDRVTERNETLKPFARDSFMTPEIESAVARVYGEDARIHAEAVAGRESED